MFLHLPNPTDLLLTYRYLILFPLVVVEGPIVTVIAGSLVVVGLFNPFLVYPMIVIADLVGDSLYYAIGRWGRQSFIEKYGRFFGLNERRLKKIEDHFDNHSGKTLIFGKITAIGSALLVAAGMSKMKYSKFILTNLLATLPKSLLLLLVGYYFSQTIVAINHYFSFAGVIMFILLLLLILVYILYKKIKNKKPTK